MADKLFYSMGEVAEMFDVNTSLIRHWESQFSILRPKRNKKGNRLFSPEDVENLKMIYHLVKERGMTLEGAKKALRKAPSESGVDRDAELMERLQRIRALLVEVREDLKAGEGEIVTASDADMTDADAAAADADAAADTAAAAETPVRRRRAKAVVKIDEPSDDAAGKAAGKPPGFLGTACRQTQRPQAPPQEGGGRNQRAVRVLRTILILSIVRKDALDPRGVLFKDSRLYRAYSRCAAVFASPRPGGA